MVNLGTAGSRSLAPHTLVACDRFAQRDMDVSGLGFPRGVTPFDDTPPVIQFPRVFAELPHALCSTADSFATHEHEIDGDVVDMEAFALARVCVAENVRFACAKYVTDGADADSATHWEAALEGAARNFATLYSKLAGVNRERTAQPPDPQLRRARRAHDYRTDARAGRTLAALWRGVFARRPELR